MVIRKVLPNDRYVVTDMEDSHRTSKKSSYNRVIAVDHMKPWCTPGGVSGVVLSEDSDDETDE
jgi:hypothetical protein